jgi:hypothetical protein
MPLARILGGHRQLDEQGADPVAEHQRLGALADVHRDHRAQAAALELFVAPEKQAAQAGGAHREHDVVYRPAERPADCLEVLERAIDDREPPRRSDRHVE